MMQESNMHAWPVGNCMDETSEELRDIFHFCSYSKKERGME